MSGNVEEWCQDWYGTYPFGSVTDPTGPASGDSRVTRGGCWYSIANGLRPANRLYTSTGNRYHILGFRLVMQP